MLLVGSILLALLPLFIAVLAAWRVERSRLLETVRDQVNTTVSLVAMLEQRRYDGARQVLAAMAAAPAVRSFNREQCSFYLTGLKRAFPAYTNLGLLDLEGQIVCSAVQPAGAVNVHDRAYFKEALRAPAVSAEYVVGRVTSLRALTFASRLDLGNAAAPTGVVFAALDLDRAAERLRALRLPDYMQVDITTQHGVVVASTQQDAGVLGQPIADGALRQQIQSAGVGLTQPPGPAGFDAVRRVGDFSPTAIVVVARVDESRMLAPVNRRLQLQLAALLAATVFGAALAWRLGQRGIAVPIAGLLSRMRRFRAGEPDKGPPAPPRTMELIALHDEFTLMHQTLEDRTHERERLLDELKLAQANVVTAQRISRIGYWELDARTGRFDGTAQLAEILGLPIPQTLDQWLELLCTADRDSLRAAVGAAWAGKGALDIEYTMQLLAGMPVWMRMQGELRTAADGTPVLLRGSLQDITERKVAQTRLSAQLGRLQLLHRITRAITERLSIAEILAVVVAQLEEQMPLAFCAAAPFDAHANVIVIEQLGVRSLSSAPALRMPAGETIAADGDGLSRAVRGELVYEPETDGLPQELPRRFSAGGLHAIVLVPLRTQSGVFGVILAARASSESFPSTDCEFLRQLGEQVALALHQAELYTALRSAYDTLQRSQAAALQQERLRALGEMASGIAHDINNGVSPLVLYIESLLKHEPGLSEAGRQKLATMQLAAEGIANTVERMREFHHAHDGSSNRRLSSLNATVERVIELTRARWRDGALREGAVIEVATDLQPDIPAVWINEGDVRDALTNLVFNAVDAMPRGGRLGVRTRVVPDLEGSPAVELSIEDSGAGMSDETRRRCLEPFFTTKQERGTGLGLAMVHAMVQRHHGRLQIDTALGKGTVVRLQFPLGAAPPEAAADAPLEARRSVSLRLLLADDDPFVLYPLRDTLQEDGHHVRTAEGGREALGLFRSELERGVPFDAVVTDLGMPHTDGSAVAREVKALRPATLVVLLTGWGRRMSDDGGCPPFVDCLLSKPPRINDLRTALARLAGGAGAATNVHDPAPAEPTPDLLAVRT
jgi:signal transduction histidine kinase/ActR/RegA family two-component response regulator